MKTTNIDKVKEIALMLLDIPIKRDKTFPSIIHHPFIENTVILENDKLIDDESKTRKQYKEAIYHIKKIEDLFVILVSKPYRPVVFDLVKDYLSDEDYNNMLRFVWVSTEFPNHDKNVSRNKWSKFFKSRIIPEILMDEGYKVYKELIEKEYIEIYRGVHSLESSRILGLSWTTNRDIALKFAKRLNKTGYVLKCTIPTKIILAYFIDRNEDEVIVNLNNTKSFYEKFGGSYEEIR